MSETKRMSRPAAKAEDKNPTKAERTFESTLTRNYATSLESALSFSFSLAELINDELESVLSFSFSLAELINDDCESETKTMNRPAAEKEEESPAKAEGIVESTLTRHFATSLESALSSTELIDEAEQMAESTLTRHYATSLVSAFSLTELTDGDDEMETKTMSRAAAEAEEKSPAKGEGTAKSMLIYRGATSLESFCFSSLTGLTDDESSASRARRKSARRKSGRRNSVRFSIVSMREFNVVELQSDGDAGEDVSEQPRKSLAWLGWEIQGESQIRVDDHEEEMKRLRADRYSRTIQDQERAEREKKGKVEREESRQLLLKIQKKGFRSRVLKPLWNGIIKNSAVIMPAPRIDYNVLTN